VYSIIARADKAEHICDLSGLGELSLVFSLHCVELVTKDFGKILFCGLFSFVFSIEETAYFPQLAGVEPKAAAAGTLIDLDFLFDAEKVPHHHNVITLRTLQPLCTVDDQACIALDIQ